jgi:peroxiredoxin
MMMAVSPTESARREAGSGFGSRLARAVAPLAVLVLAALLAGCPGRDEAVDPATPVGTEVGERAPPLSGVAADGRDYELRPARGESTVIVFFRGFHCGLCRVRLQELQMNLDEYQASGARVVAVTPDEPTQVQRAVEELGLGFPVVSADSAVLASWGLIDGERALPLPASYLLDSRGVVVYRHVGRNAADRAHDIEILAVLQQVRGRRG